MDFWKSSSTLVKVLLVIVLVAVVALIIALVANVFGSNDAGSSPPTPPAEAVPTFTPTGEAVQLPSGPIVVANSVVNVRLGPGTDYPEIGALQAGQTAPVIGRSEDGTWYVITFPSSFGDQGWVSADVVTAANVENVPVIAPPALPAPGETPTPTTAPQAPSAAIDAPAQGQVGAPVTFSAAQSTGTAPLVQYAWSFGDGSVADAVTVEKTYDAPGVYLVNLKVVDQNGQEGTAQHQITIGPAPQETPTPTEESGDIEIPDSLILVTVDGAPASVAIVGGIPTFDAGVGQTVKLDATPALELYPTLQVSWDMGDGSPAISGIAAEHQYDAASVYQIVIAATDGQQAVTKLWQVNVTE